MRTTIDIDESLLSQAMGRGRRKTKKEVVNDALREYVEARLRQDLIDMIGSEEFEIDLTLEELREMRGRDRAPIPD
jgi:Arc/MetJ family transcription regulator